MNTGPARELRLEVTRSARCYAQGGEAATEAWMLLHGYGQLASRFLRAFESLATPERLLVAPEGLSRFYLEAGSGKVGASWMTKEDRTSEIADYLAYLERVRQELIPAVPLTVLGFSQGVATAARFALAATPAPAHLVCWGGLVPEEVAPAQLRAIRLTLVVGEREEWAPVAAVEAQAAVFRAAGVSVAVVRFPGGHEISREVVARLA